MKDLFDRLGYVALGIVLGALIALFFLPRYVDQIHVPGPLVIKTNTIVQYKQSPVPPNADCEWAISELNQFRTNDGRTWTEKNRIWSELYTRKWSVDYDIKRKPNMVTVFVGTGIGGSYQYELLDTWYAGPGVITDGKSIYIFAGISHNF